MTMKIHAITVDTANPQKLAAWWAEALGIGVGQDYGFLVQLADAPDLPRFQFAKIEDIPTGKNRVHFDLRTADLDQETERLVSLGATVVQKFETPQFRYTTLLDVDGNKFDLVSE
jgi:predicted enzyme related to lactoylglutathione lyase